MATEIRERGKRHDRWVNWIVVGIVVIALLLGWLVKTMAEGRTVLFDEAGIQARYPAGWVRVDVQPPLLLQVEDRWAEPFRTTLILQRRPLQGSLNAVRQTLALERAQGWGECTAYRVLQTEEAVPIAGRTAVHASFAYVETNSQPFMETAPVVMHGEDYMFPVGQEVYIVTITAAEANYERAHGTLQTFMDSLQAPK